MEHYHGKAQRELDGCFFRVKRDSGYENVCFTDLTPEEQDSLMLGRSEEWLRSLCKYLAEVISNIGEQFDLKGDFH